MTRFENKQRKLAILHSGKDLAEQSSIYDVTLKQIAFANNCSHQTVLHHFRSIQQWRDDVVRNAIACQQYRIIAQAIVHYDPLVDKVPYELRERALISQVSA